MTTDHMESSDNDEQDALHASEITQAEEAELRLGNLTKLELSPLGYRPYKCPEVITAWWKLRSTHSSVSGLFDTLYLVRHTRSRYNNTETRGRLSSDAQDLLRAAIVFTSAGLDASVQALLDGAVPLLITRPDGTPRKKYETFIEEQVRSPKPLDDFLSALKSPDPGAPLLKLYLKSKTASSFQGSTDLRNRAGGALGITRTQIPASRYTALDRFFTARNDVAHRLDMEDPHRAATPPRILRGQEEVRAMCDQALFLVRDMIHHTAANLAGCR